MKCLLTLMVFLCAGLVLSAQETQENDDPYQNAPVPDSLQYTGPNLVALGDARGDSIVLRWSPVDPVTWRVANEKGFVIDRFELVNGKYDFSSRKRLTPQALLPLDLDAFKQRFGREDTMAAAVAQAMFGAPIITSPSPLGAVVEQHTQQQALFGIAMLMADVRPEIADAMALRYVDRDVRPGIQYIYQIHSLTLRADHPVDTASIMLIRPDDVVELPQITSLEIVEEELALMLTWNRQEDDMAYSAYYVERSFDGGASWQRLNNRPHIGMRNVKAAERQQDPMMRDLVTYKVKLEENYKPALYRIVGVNLFGRESEPGPAVQGMGRDLTPPSPVNIDKPEVVGNDDVKITWNVKEEEADLLGFYVGYSKVAEGPFYSVSELLPREAREWVHINAREAAAPYYIVSSVDTAGNFINSIPVFAAFPDSIPPAVPEGLSGTIDSAGVVTLTWNANSEDDIYGYRVFFANQDDHEYLQITTDITDDTVFVDTLTLQTLSRDIYYKVVALDFNYNHSEFTEPLLLKKPDIVPPAAPLIRDVLVSDSAVVIQWHSSPSSDAQRHTLYRRTMGGDEWQAIYTSSAPAVTSYTDKSAEATVLYEYVLEAEDESGLLSPKSNSVSARVYDSGLREGVEKLRFEIDKEKGRIVLRWQYGATGDHQFYLYKAMENGQLVLIESLSGSVNEYADSDVSRGGNYRYGLKVVTPDGGESGMAATQTISFE